ncbi:PREDICTED: uncharacterized protein LOC106115411 [Papilio xuthus]|uniref:Coiled-coil domain-containing protein 74B n=1 Tax=Papilio xuthus TaxID=66420 RepID=A0A194Q7E4_PAPXU|nr:PREDICTED: uncharacterized protein LOC106115411 [Papilio xuthus]KPI99325.1 Coiled-coil domain-containing protein 74B [Papilio xuthus]
MASKVLVPTSPFAKLQVKKSPPEAASSGFFVGADAGARVAHLEHSVRFLQEQHRQMLSGLHAEIEALRERNRDLQFQLIFNKDSAPKSSATIGDEPAVINEEVQSLRVDVCRLEREAAAARGEARAAEARALQLQKQLDALTVKLKTLDCRSGEGEGEGGGEAESGAGGGSGGGGESRGTLRARLADAERLVRRLRGDAERQRREVHAGAAAAAAPGGAVTNLLFDGAAARHAHLQCMKNSLQATVRAGAFDSFGFQNTYAFPPMQDYWVDTLAEEVPRGGRRRPLALPELVPHRATIFANPHARGRSYGYEKSKKTSVTNGDTVNGKPAEEHHEQTRLKELSTDNLSKKNDKKVDSMVTYPELKIVVTKIIPHGKVNVTGAGGAGGAGPAGEARPRPRRHHRKHATDHT